MVGLPDSLTESTNRKSTSHQDHKAFVEVHCDIYLLVFQKKIDSKKLPDLYILSDLSKDRICWRKKNVGETSTRSGEKYFNQKSLHQSTRKVKNSRKNMRSTPLIDSFMLMQRRRHNSSAESQPRDKTLQANIYILLESFLNNLLQDLLNSAFTRLVLTP